MINGRALRCTVSVPALVELEGAQHRQDVTGSDTPQHAPVGEREWTACRARLSPLVASRLPTARKPTISPQPHTLPTAQPRWLALTAQEKALIGSEYFGVSEFVENLALVRSGRVEPLKVITHRFPPRRGRGSLVLAPLVIRLFFSRMTRGASTGFVGVAQDQWNVGARCGTGRTSRGILQRPCIVSPSPVSMVSKTASIHVIVASVVHRTRIGCS